MRTFSGIFKSVVLALVFSAWSAPGNAQTLVDSLAVKIAPELLREDLEILQSTLESSQPGLYLYISKDSLDKVFQGMNSSLTEPLTSIEFFRRIAPLNGILKNLHTRIWPSAAYEKAIETILPRFPLDIHWENETMYVLRNHSNVTEIKEGAIIRSINGENSKSIFKVILDCRVRDGFNESYPIAQASRNFSFYYAQLFGTPHTFSLELVEEDGTSKNIHLPAALASDIHTSRATKYHRKYSPFSEDWDAWMANKEPALKLDVKDDIAVLTVRTFYQPIIEANGQDYEEFFDKAFEQVTAKNIKHLIIDLRNNHGGTDPVGMSLLSHLYDGRLNYYKRRSSIVKPDAKHKKNGDLYEIIGRGVWTGRITPAKNVYRQKKYVLMNGYSVSAAGEFIGHLKNLGTTIFVGKEAGGNPVVFTGGVSLPLDLPHTRITGTIPLNLVEMNVSYTNTGHGVLPDHEITPSIDEILNEKDVEMEFVLNLINRSRR